MIKEGMKKGKIAEKIVEQMFKEAGFKVKRAGYENTFTDLAQQKEKIGGPAGQYIRHHPDLIVINPRNEAFLIEVKYRRFGVINQRDMFNYPETQIILLTKDSMHCQSMKEIYKNGKKFIALDWLKPFSEIPSAIRAKYIKKIKRKLGDENLIGQLIENISEKIVGKPFTQTYTPGEINFTYIEDFNKEGDSYEKIENKEIITDKSGNSGYSYKGKQWNNDEIKKLLELYQSGKSINEIASTLNRKRKAVLFKLVKEGKLNMRQAINLIKSKNEKENSSWEKIDHLPKGASKRMHRKHKNSIKGKHHFYIKKNKKRYRKKYK